jgi:hypothetical protein
MRVQLISVAASAALAFGLNFVMRPSLDVDVAKFQSGVATGELELKREGRRHVLPLADLQVISKDVEMLFGRAEPVRYLLLSGRGKDDAGGVLRLWADFAQEGSLVEANARDATVLSHRTLPIVPKPIVVSAPSQLVLPRKGPVAVLSGSVRITSALPVKVRGGAHWRVRGDVVVEVQAEDEPAELWEGPFKGEMWWP